MSEQTKKRLWERLRLGDVPITVVSVAAVGGFFALKGFESYPEGFSSFPYALDPLYYVVMLFTHSEPSQYLGNMYFLVPAGILLTYLTNNRKVLYVITVSHIPTVTLCATIGMDVVGAGAAAYGILAAVLVRTTWFCAEEYSGAVRVGSSVAAVGLAGAALVALVATAGGSRIVYLIPVSGFLLGGTFESCRVLYAFGREEPDSSILPDGFNAPRFRSRWENMADDTEEAENLEEKYIKREAAPDDTYAGSRGRSRKD
jgi:hypothetical protein